MPSEGWSSFNPTSKSGIILKALFDQPRKLTHDQAQKLTLRDYCNIVRVSVHMSYIVVPINLRYINVLGATLVMSCRETD